MLPVLHSLAAAHMCLHHDCVQVHHTLLAPIICLARVCKEKKRERFCLGLHGSMPDEFFDICSLRCVSAHFLDIWCSELL